MDDIYHVKYLKYKDKYLELKDNIITGGSKLIFGSIAKHASKLLGKKHQIKGYIKKKNTKLRNILIKRKTKLNNILMKKNKLMIPFKIMANNRMKIIIK
jgi:hypothetical protein